MKNVLIRGPLLSYSGYGTHSRQIYRWLEKQNNVKVSAALLSWGITPWMINPDIEDGLVGRIMKNSSVDLGSKYDVSIQIQLPNEWDASLAKVNIGVSAFVETDRCNPSWIQHCNKMDLIVVPSKHVEDVIRNSGDCQTPVIVIPEAYYEQIADKNIEPIDLDLGTDFNFLIFGQITGNSPDTDRKNLFNTMKWMCEAFHDREDVGIVIKTNSGRNTKIDKKVTSMMLQKLLEEIRVGPYPRVHLLHGAMSSKEIASLYRHPKIKALVSLTRGEGFGLPILEAAASGMPVITTSWSGHMDFMKLGKFIPVSYSLSEISQNRVDNNIFMEGSKWAEADELNAKQRLTKFLKSSSIPNKWAKDLRDKIIPLFSQEKIERHYSKAFKEFLK